MKIKREWLFRKADPQLAKRIVQEVRVSPFLARLLVARGVDHPEKVWAFLHPDLSQLHSPDLLPDLPPAVEQLKEALRRREKILVHGDYDADGVCASALLTRALKALGARVTPFIPNRRQEGYDLRPETVERAYREGYRVILTADCGTNAGDALRLAYQRGLTVIVTDHHTPLDPAFPFKNLESDRGWVIVNPFRPDSQYPFPTICGTTLAYKLIQALGDALGKRKANYARAFLDLVAIATIADAMPLVEENRALVYYGLKYLSETKKEGLRALCRNLGLGNQGTSAPASQKTGEVPPYPSSLPPILARDIAYLVAPRLNAAGRMECAEIALDLLLTRDPNEASVLARQLEDKNRERMAEQKRVLQQAWEQLRSQRAEHRYVYVLAGSNWNQGVVGIIAGRILHTLGQPTLVIGIHEGEAHGSGRSIKGFSLLRALEACRDLLLRYGGHELAVGFDLDPKDIPAFRERINAFAEEIGDRDRVNSIPPLWVDLVLEPSSISWDLLKELSLLEPFGHGNPEPLFMSSFTLLGCEAIGEQKEHLRLRLRGEGTTPMSAIFWQAGALSSQFKPGGEIEVCYKIEVNRFNGSYELRLKVEDLREPEGGLVSSDLLKDYLVAEDGEAYDPFLEGPGDLLNPGKDDSTIALE